jgi:hypothetical protein
MTIKVIVGNFNHDYMLILIKANLLKGRDAKLWV